MERERASDAAEAIERRRSVNLAEIAAALVTGGLVAIVALAPWPIGSVEPWTFWPLVLSSWILLGLRGAALVVRPRGRVPLPFSTGTAAVLLLLVLSWSGLQASTSMPVEWAHPIRALLPPSVPAIAFTPSLDPDRTVEATARLSAYVAVGVLAFLAARRRRRAERLLGAVLVVQLLQAAVGLLREALGLREVLGYELASGRASGTFVNANHFAAYVNLGVVATTVLLLDRLRSDPDSPKLGAVIARTLVALLDRHLLLTASLAILLMASLASGSRGGFSSLALTLVVVASLRIGRGRLLLVTLGALAAIGGLFLVTAGVPTLERLDELFPASEFEPGAGGRLAAFGLAIEAWLQRPWLGHGLGSWPALFHTVRDERFPTVQFDYVHNTWLELLVELGAPAFAALLIAWVLLLWGCYRAAVRAREPLPTIGLGCAVLVGLHSLVDFPLQIPAVALTFAVIFGLALGRSAVLAQTAGRVARGTFSR